MKLGYWKLTRLKLTRKRRYNFIIKEINAIGGDNWNKFILTMDAKKFKLNKTELTSLLIATTIKMNSKCCKPSLSLL